MSVAREWTCGVKLVPVGLWRCCSPSGHFCTTPIPSTHTADCRTVFWWLTTFLTSLQTMAAVSGVAVTAGGRGWCGEWVWEEEALLIVRVREVAVAPRSWFHRKSDCWYVSGKTSPACWICAQTWSFQQHGCITNIVPLSSQSPPSRLCLVFPVNTEDRGCQFDLGSHFHNSLLLLVQSKGISWFDFALKWLSSIFIQLPVIAIQRVIWKGS